MTSWTKVLSFGTACLVLCTVPSLAAWPNDSAQNLAICTASSNQLTPQICSDGSGGVFIVWNDNRGASGDIYAQHVLPAGTVDPTWPANGLVVCNAASNQRAPSIVADGGGGAIVAWDDFRTGNYDIYADRLLSSGLDPAWPSNGRALCQAAGDQISSIAISDGSGGAFIAWQDQRAAAGDDIYAQHVRMDGTLDPSWPADGRAFCTAANVQQRLKGIPDGTGGAILAWQDQRSGTGTDDIYAHHILSSGLPDPAWPSDGRLVCGAAGLQQSPSISTDGGHGAIVTWYDQRAGSTNSDIYAHHLLSTGSLDPSWPLGGTAICTASGNQQFPVLIGDGAHGAIVGWADGRTASFHIYAQRVLASGAVDPSWPTDGVAVCPAANSQANPAIVSDGNGGAVLSWTDFRSDPSAGNIYAQHVLVTGVTDPSWAPDGNALSTATGSQTVPRTVPDMGGGEIATWIDLRNGGTNVDVFAQRIEANGQLGGNLAGVPSEPERAFAIRAVYPNPWNGRLLDIQYTVSTATYSLRLELKDVCGREVWTSEAETLTGTHSAVIAVTHPLKPGIYFLVLRHGSESAAVRLAVYH